MPAGSGARLAAQHDATHARAGQRGGGVGARWCTPLVMERTAAWCAALTPPALSSKRRLQGSQSAPVRRQRPWLGLLPGKLVPTLLTRRPFIKNSSDLRISRPLKLNKTGYQVFRPLVLCPPSIAPYLAAPISTGSLAHFPPIKKQRSLLQRECFGATRRGKQRSICPTVVSTQLELWGLKAEG